MTKKYGPYICTNCYHDGSADYNASFFLGLFLLLCFILPGVIYMLWAWGKGKNKCPKCKRPDMVPVKSVRGKELVKSIAGPEAQITSIPYAKIRNTLIILILITLFFSLGPIVRFFMGLSG